MDFIKKNLSRIAIVAAVFFIGIFAVVLTGPMKMGAVLPGNFMEAREQAAAVSKRVVELTSEIGKKIKAANISDLTGRTLDARTLIQEAKTNNTEAYQNAFELSRHLQRLAESLAELKSSKSQRLAYEAVAVELALVSEFITYTQNLNRFLDNLDRAIAFNSGAARDEVRTALQEVNRSAETINRLNMEFLAKMKKFDSSL